MAFTVQENDGDCPRAGLWSSTSWTLELTVRETGQRFKLTTVYGLIKLARKAAFLRELKDCRPAGNASWLILGDFNLIYRARDENNRNLNRALMPRFRDALNENELKEIHLQNRKFTWSNEQRRPTSIRLDRLFCNAAWDLAFSDHILQALSTALSDHCPLLLTSGNAPVRLKTFRFENFWIKMPGFKETVHNAWNEDNPHTEPLHRLNFKLQTTASRLKRVE